MRAAIPAYLEHNFSAAPPGHRFTLYFEGWCEDFSLAKNNKAEALKQTVKLGAECASMLSALRERQLTVAQTLQGEIFDAITVAPFATGLGIEHPLENGFAFLNPYGLPYLPGSSVKGVVRAAAEELSSGSFGSASDWKAEHVDALFGHVDSSYRRGALMFWDVYPTQPGNTMRVDVMTPHQSHYYQDGKTPHDSGSPNPIPFLTVAPGAQFRFIVTCNDAYLQSDALKDGGWKPLLQAAFEHAYEWLGFGAKTAVGYGAMRLDIDAMRQREEDIARAEAQRREAEEARRREAEMSPVDRKIYDAKASRQPGQSEYSAVYAAIEKGVFEEHEIFEAAEKLKAMMQAAKVWKETTASKRPEKDKEHQRTLQVLRWLNRSPSG